MSTHHRFPTNHHWPIMAQRCCLRSPSPPSCCHAATMSPPSQTIATTTAGPLPSLSTICHHHHSWRHLWVHPPPPKSPQASIAATPKLIMPHLNKATLSWHSHLQHPTPFLPWLVTIAPLRSRLMPLPPPLSPAICHDPPLTGHPSHLYSESIITTHHFHLAHHHHHSHVLP